MRSLCELLAVSSKNTESAWTLHCLFEKCGVHTNSPSAEPAWTPHLRSALELPSCFREMRSSNELPTVLLKMRSSFQLPTLFLKNVQSASTSHCLFKKCGVYANSSLWVPKMRSLLELSTVFLKNAEFTQTPPLQSPLELHLCGVRLNCRLVFKKCGVQTNSPLCF